MEQMMTLYLLNWKIIHRANRDNKPIVTINETERLLIDAQHKRECGLKWPWSNNGFGYSLY